MPSVGKDGLLCALDEVEAHVQPHRSSGPSRNTSGHDSLSAGKLTNEKSTDEKNKTPEEMNH